MIAGPGRAGLGPGPGRAAGCLQVFRLPFRLPWRLPASVSAARSSVAVLSTRIMTRMRLSRVRAKVDSECQPECHRAMVLPLHPLLRRPYAVHRAAGHTDWQARRPGPWQPPRSLGPGLLHYKYLWPQPVMVASDGRRLVGVSAGTAARPSRRPRRLLVTVTSSG